MGGILLNLEGFVFGLRDQDSWLDIGLAVFGLSILTGIVALLYGRTRGTVRRREGWAQNPPAPGRIPGERHRNIQTVAAR